jgi:hypothetical protein
MANCPDFGQYLSTNDNTGDVMKITTGIAASWLIISLTSACSQSSSTQPTQPPEVSPAAGSGFLDDYSKLTPQASAAGEDLVYVAPGAFEKLAKYTGVMVDQPEILLSADSEYKGAKPEDLRAISEMMRSTLSEALKAGGRNVVEQPGPDVIYLRLGLTDLYLKKKKRNVLGYTPIGFVVKAGVDAVQGMMDNVDIVEMSFEAEVKDSQSGEQLGAIVVRRGARKAEGQKEQRIDFDEFQKTVDIYALRFRCRLDNARLPASQQQDCLAIAMK